MNAKDSQPSIKTARNVLAILCSFLVCSTVWTNARPYPDQRPTDVLRVLDWLPADTETLLVANGPFWISNIQNGEEDDDKNHEVSSEKIEKSFEGLTLALFNLKNGILEKHLSGKQVILAVEGSRHFRPPADLGETPFEGCAIAVFSENDNIRDAFMKDAAAVAEPTEVVEGEKVAVFKESMERDVWTMFVAFPKKGIVLVATNRNFLKQVLMRVHEAGGQRALPDSLPEWRFVDKSARFWGLRHYDRRQMRDDPTSPFGGEKAANLPDEQAIGITYRCDPGKGKQATLMYLSGARNEIRKIEEKRFPSSSEPEANAGLHIRYRVLEPGVIESNYELTYSRPLDWFFFVFAGTMGHAVYL